MKKLIFSGSAVALVTPFSADGSEVNFDVLEELVEFHNKNGTKALVVCATTGEFSTLSKSERKKIIKFVVDKTRNRIPVIAGVGANCTRKTLNNCLDAQELGADAFLVITPYYNKANQEGLFKHYEYINDRVNLPIIIYNNPARTSVNIQPETYKRLSGLNNINSVKEANSDLSRFLIVKSLCKNDLVFYSGNDDLALPMMSIGASGVISTFANIFPKIMSNICEFCFENRKDKSLDLLLKYINIMDLLFCDVNPIPVKKALNLMGFNVGIPRLPLTELNDEISVKLDLEIKKFF
ncbi:MAG: 4-hydroxy-tetrahydrodipicolinate synthase [Candidatus Improbicoccus pseudotrichonymphae]|uniref:4-hydroxy-tetrahydrodipicolinate synthase n=1 Tax=Candidatus Improbicoccus pseudotrichonymphae TaxID=3033792 RepID=A0AA48I8D4_9FIRM|nr:MAG: 4-hydroxy-tetrahydrodipicolinate synthase [Candidatus Improbicoccus pseudotrichonymphae]